MRPPHEDEACGVSGERSSWKRDNRRLLPFHWFAGKERLSR